MSKAFEAMMKSAKTTEIVGAGFVPELTSLINKHGKDSYTYMPDYILANHISDYIENIAALMTTLDILDAIDCETTTGK